MKRILITGAAGFIGSHTAESLLRLGHTVIGIDNFDPFYDKTYKDYNLSSLLGNPNFDFVELDIRDKDHVNRLFATKQIDAVIHLAAKAGVRPSIEDINSYYDVNINGTLNILNAMKDAQVTKMLFASSSSVYGNNKKVPFSESDNVDFPISPYAATKKSGELLCHVFTHLYGFDITCLRFFTVFGPRQRPDLAIHKFTRLIDQGQPIPFYGDGSTARDYTYIDDIVSGIVCALNNIDGYRVYNLGESRVVKLSELLEILEKKIGKAANINRMDLQPGDVEKTYADISKARNEIGYNPIFDIEQGVDNFVQWYNKMKDLKS